MTGPFSSRRGFTLIELLVVIAVIGILASVIMARVNDARAKARDARRIQDFQQIRTALELYYQANGSYPIATYWISSYDSSWNTLATALAPYMSSLPKDPLNNGQNPWVNGEYTYAYGYSPALKPGVQKYDLITQFEVSGNPNRCQVKQWYFYADTQIWCGSYSQNIYTGDR